MTREQFERAGYRVLSCKATPKCHNVDHIHCELTEGVEYCPQAKRILILSTMMIGKPVHRLCLDDINGLAAATRLGFEALHPDWKLEDIAFA